MKRSKIAQKKKFVAYYRVSTQKQGNSQLGLEAQKETVKKFTEGKERVIKEFVEVETGKKNRRPELQEAIDFATANEAKLIIAKLDRLSRNAGFIFTLRDSGVDFVACDLPDANTLTIGIFAAMAQHEREVISRRTKEALAAKKAQGFKLGKPENLTDKARERSVKSRRETAMKQEYNIRAYQIIKDLRKKEMSLRAIAKKLNEYRLRTAKSKNFTACTVSKIIKLYERE